MSRLAAARRLRRMAVLACCVMLAPAALAQSLQALVIANARYTQTSPLANPGRDAQLVSEALRRMGFEVTVRQDLGTGGMDRAVNELSQRTRSADGLVLVYYAGHAVQIKGKNYLQPVDASFASEQEVRAQGIDVDRLLGLLESPQPRQATVLVLDACRDNPFSGSRRGTAGLMPRMAGNALIAFSTAPHSMAFDGGNKGFSPYATAFVQSVARSPASIEDLFRDVADRVYAATGGQQSPWFHSSLRAVWGVEQQRLSLKKAPSLPAGTASGGGRGSAHREEADATNDDDLHPSVATTVDALWREVTRPRSPAEQLAAKGYRLTEEAAFEALVSGDVEALRLMKQAGMAPLPVAWMGMNGLERLATQDSNRLAEVLALTEPTAEVLNKAFVPIHDRGELPPSPRSLLEHLGVTVVDRLPTAYLPDARYVVPTPDSKGLMLTSSTLLMRAVWSRQTQAVRALLERGAGPDTPQHLKVWASFLHERWRKPWSGYGAVRLTPLAEAERLGLHDIARLLRERGATSRSEIDWP